MRQYPDPNQPAAQPNQGQESTRYGRYQPPPYAAPPAEDATAYPQHDFPQRPFSSGSYQQQQQGDYQPPRRQASYLNTLALKFDPRNIIAGVGGLFALIGFFLPYISYMGRTISGSQLAGGLGYGYSFGHYWLDLFLALGALVVVVLLEFGEQWFRTSTNATLQKLVTSLSSRKRQWVNWLIILGAAGIVLHILDLGGLSYWGIGAWFHLLGMAAIVIGGYFYLKPYSPSLKGV